MKKSTAALAIALVLSSVAEGGPRKPPASRPKTAASQPSSAPKQAARKLFSKWHGGSCELNGQRMVLMLGKTKKEVKLPDLRGEDEKNPSKPLQIICKKEGAKIIYERRIDVFDSYEELIKGATSAVSVALKQKAIEGAFIKEGKEAVVAFENGQVQQLDLLDGDEFTRWTSEKPDDETRFSRASVGESGSYVHVIFPETGRYVLLYTDCNGKEVAYEDQAKGGVSIRCTGAVCVTKDEKNRVVETLKVPCPPKTEKK